MQSLKINVTRIDKTAMVKGEKGTYLDLVLFENKNGPDQYGNDGFVVQDIPRQRREAGEKGPIIGNWRHLNRTAAAPAPAPAASSCEDGDDIPF